MLVEREDEKCCKSNVQLESNYGFFVVTRLYTATDSIITMQ